MDVTTKWLGRWVVFTVALAAIFPAATWSDFEEWRIADWALSQVRESSYYFVNVYTYAGDEASQYKTYTFDYTDQDNPLLEKDMFKLVEQELAEKGWERDDENPQALVSMTYFIGKREQYVPPTTITSTRVNTYWNWNPSWGSDYNYLGGTMTPNQVPITDTQVVPGHTEVSYYRNVQLNFLDYAQAKAGSKVVPLIWKGEADSEGSVKDLRAAARVMIPVLLKDFPKGWDVTAAGDAPSPKLRAYLFTYYRLGISLKAKKETKDGVYKYKDLTVVSAVEPESPAARSGLRPGDVITGIEGGMRDGDYPFLWLGETNSAAGNCFTLKIKRSGKKGRTEKVEVSVRPEITTTVLFEPAE